MNKINLITLLVKARGNCLYHHYMTPGGKMGDYHSEASGGYVSGVHNAVDAIRTFAPHVAAVVVTPWDDDDGKYEVSLSVSIPTINLLKSKGLTFALEGFWEQKWDGRREFSCVIPESEIASRLDAIQALVQRWNEHLD